MLESQSIAKDKHTKFYQLVIHLALKVMVFAPCTLLPCEKWHKDEVSMLGLGVPNMGTCGQPPTDF